jgi:hypothetical protein
MPTFRHGKNSQFTIADAGAAVRDISNTLNSVTMPRSIETLETTSFGSTSKSYVVGFSDSTISIEGSFDATVDGYLSGLVGNETASAFVYGPEGSTNGQVKYTGTAFLTSYEVNGGVGDIVSYSAEFQVTGAITRGTYA